MKFDLLKVFKQFTIAAISPIHTIEGSYQAIDPEVSFERIFGPLEPVASNISNLIMKLTKNFVFASFDRQATEFISMQHQQNFKTSMVSSWMIE